MHALMISLAVALCKGTCSYQSHCRPHFKTLGVEQLVDLLHLGALIVLEGWEIIVLVLLSAATQSVDDGVRGVDFHDLLGRHVARHGAVLEGLRLHDALHVRGPAVLASHEAAWGGGQTVCDHNLLSLVTEHLLDELAEVLARGLLLLELLLLILSLLEVETLLGDGHKLLAVVLLELLHGVLIDGVGEVEHLEATLLELLNEGGRLHSLLRLTSDVVDVLLLLLHARNVLLKAGHLLARLGGVVAHELSELGTVLRILMDAELEVLAELLIELSEILSVLSDLVEHLEGLLHQVLLDHLQDLGALQHLTRNVEGEVLRVD